MDKRSNYEDIESLIKEIDHIKVNLNDPLLGSVFWEEAMKSFIEKHSGELIDMLHELEKYREKERG
jgi:hypothetical protein